MDKDLRVKKLAAQGVEWISVPELPISSNGEYQITFPEGFPCSVKHFVFPKNFRSAPNFHSFLEIFYVQKGEGVYYIQDRKYEISKGDVLLVSASSLHYLETNSQTELRIVCLAFMPEIIYNPSTYDIDFGLLLPFYYNGNKISHLINEIEPHAKEIIKNIDSIDHQISTSGRFYKLEMKILLGSALLSMLKYYDSKLDDLHLILRSELNLKRTKEVYDYIHKHYTEAIKLSEIAKSVSISEAHLCRYFKKVSGMTITDYIHLYRINCAKKLLLHSDMNISEICYSVGFTSPSYFNLIFNRLANCSPLVYRSSNMK